MPTTEARSYRDIAYGPSKAQTLDLFLPSADHVPARVVVFVHGGGWGEGDKADGQEKGAMDGVRRGYAVASVNYRLSGEATFPAALLDVRAAIRFLRASAKRYGLDKDRLRLGAIPRAATLSRLSAPRPRHRFSLILR